ncbi:MAG: hypothetical protein ABIP46_11555 [Polaromonas sp.]
MTSTNLQRTGQRHGCRALLAAAVMACGLAAVQAQTPGLPAAAESAAPASKIGPPVPLMTSPVPTTPMRGSTTLTLPQTTTDPSGTTLPPIKPAPAPRG